MDASQLLSDAEITELSRDQFEAYQYAVAHINDENANGPWGGWARAYAVLEGLGWAKVERFEGHRSFVRLERPVKVEKHFDYRAVL